MYLNSNTFDDPRISGALSVYIRGACYICLFDSNRRIPKTEIAEWSSDDDIDIATGVTQLVDNGVWVDMGGDYHVPDLGFFMSDAEGDALGIAD